jgi:hypothetical protein
MNKTFILILLLFASGNTFGQTEWKNITFYKTNGKSSITEKQYSIITIAKNGNGSLEYFDSAKVKSFNFTLSKDERKSLNKKLKKSGILKLNSAKLKSKTTGSEAVTGPSANMTITLEFTEEQKEEIAEEKEREKESNEGNNGKNKMEDENEKPPLIIIPSEYNTQYAASVKSAFEAVENCVPESILEKSGIKK